MQHIETSKQFSTHTLWTQERMGKRKKPPVSRKEKRKLKRANKKQNKRDWFLKQHKKAAGTSTGASLIIQQQQEEIERLRHELQAKESKTKKKKKKRRGLTYEELNSKRDNRESIEFDGLWPTETTRAASIPQNWANRAVQSAAPTTSKQKQHR